MQISDNNYNRIYNLLDNPSFVYINAVDIPTSNEHHESLWKLGSDLENQSLCFRIVRLFARFKSLFPSFLLDWYQLVSTAG
jgi:hypothetical protein